MNFVQRPAVKFLIPFVLGILIGWELDLHLLVNLFILLFFVALYGFIRLSKNFQSEFLTILVYLLILLLGNFKISLDRQSHHPLLIRNFIQAEKKEIYLIGIVSDHGVRKKERFNFMVSAETLVVGNKVFYVKGGVLVTLSLKDGENITIADNVSYGRKILVKGELTHLHERRNPHEFDYHRWLTLQDVYARMWINSQDIVWLGEKVGNPILLSVIFPLREWIGRKFDELVGGEEAKLLKGLVIGERSEMALEIKTAFINSGLMHILAVSGFNVGLVSMIFWSIFSIFRLPEKVRAIFTVLVLLMFMYLAGSQPPVVRAVIMAVLIIGAKVLEYKVDLYNVVAIAAIVQLIFDSRVLFDAGFQLSFSAVLALAYIYPKFNSIQQRLPENVGQNIVLRYMFVSFAVSLAAILGTTKLKFESTGFKIST